MRYFETQPANHLAALVECFWTLEDDDGDATSQPERLLPDGCVELILNFCSRFQEHKDNGRKERQPTNLIVGQMTQPIVISPTGPVRLFGIRFHPGGAFPFFRVPMDELTNHVTDLEAISGGFERDLWNRAGEPTTRPGQITAVEELLTERISELDSASSLLRLISKIVDRNGQISVDQIAHDAGSSCRQLERRFLREVGISPKLLCRILRFQQVFRAVDRNDGGWAAVAVDCGYYDQAHLIRDFNQFSGQTPVSLFEHPSALTKSFTRKDRMSDFSNKAA